MANVTCAVCGSRFNARSTARYCTERCKGIAKRSRPGFKERKARLQANWVATLSRDCAWCGKQFKPSSPHTLHCSQRCVSDSRWRDKASPVRWCSEVPPYTACRWCARVSYEAGRNPSRCCSDRCRDALGRCDRNGPTKTDLVYLGCSGCGSRWARATHHAGSTYCPSCRKAEERRRRRAAMRGAGESEVFTLREIAERDRWTCHICGKSVPDVAYSYQLTDATIDHLVPVSEGGAHTRANVRLAHMVCNSRRGTQGSVQLSLVG